MRMGVVLPSCSGGERAGVPVAMIRRLVSSFPHTGPESNGPDQTSPHLAAPLTRVPIPWPGLATYDAADNRMMPMIFTGFGYDI
ncbi:hypothetical protein GCM10018772_24000 [Streptomyces fumanus]|uniref:Uncharacterized protein n=1 Tax=Streptomyces fumanus TaxID=67302 RepID=A0A919ACD0_9ACTN|nr:hypothetical protein GCM10018772_24000 [Streptomyces fumanus]